MVVIDQVFVAERETQDALADESAHGVLEELLSAGVTKAIRETSDQIDGPIGRPQKQRVSVRGDGAAVKVNYRAAASDGCKQIVVCATVCRHGGFTPPRLKSFSQNNFC